MLIDNVNQLVYIILQVDLWVYFVLLWKQPRFVPKPLGLSIWPESSLAGY